MLCDDVKRHAYFFLDGSLDERVRFEFESHIVVCDGCGVRVTIHRRLRRFLRERLPQVAAPETLRARLWHSLRSARGG